jgi:hypothetical protein
MIGQDFLNIFRRPFLARPEEMSNLLNRLALRQPLENLPHCPVVFFHANSYPLP